MAHAILPLAAARRWLRHRGLQRCPSSYGTLEDFRKFLGSAHDRGIRVIIEMVLNHTSDQHPWFQESRSSPDNPRRDWYVWSDTDRRYKGVRIIFLDTETSNWAWDPIQILLLASILQSPARSQLRQSCVREQMWNVMKFWLEMGVDGFRLDAVPYLVEREGTIVRTCRRPTRFLKELRRNSMNNSPAGCFWRRPISGPRIFAHISATEMSSTWRFIFADAQDVHGAEVGRPQAHH